MNDNAKSEPRIEFRDIPGNQRQVQVLTWQPGEREPFEILVDVIRRKKRVQKKQP